MLRVLVLGVPRSGTTWIGEVLGRCDGASYVHEPDGVHEPFGFVARSALPPGFCLSPNEQCRAYESLWAGAFAGGAKATTLVDHAARRLYAGVTTEQRARVRNGGSPTSRLRLASRLARPRTAVPGLDAVVVKSVDAALTAEWIAQRFNPNVVVVQRDLRSVLASWITLDMAGPQQRNYEVLTDFARSWWDVELPGYGVSKVVRSAVVCSVWSIALSTAAARHDWTVLRYEDAAVDPEAQFRRVTESCSLSFGDRALGFLNDSNRPGSGYSTQRVAGSTIDSWKERLDAEQVTAIETVVACFPASLR